MTPSTTTREKHAPAHESLTDQAVAFIDTHPGVTIPEIAAGLGHPHHWRLAKRSGDLKARGYVTCGERKILGETYSVWWPPGCSVILQGLFF